MNPSSSPQVLPFGAEGRFEYRDSLGSGSFGEVYLVEDRRSGSLMAMKSLRRAGPKALSLFKQEFRALADVVHPNLVQLYELFSEGEAWYFTLEYVRGRSFLKQLWRSAETRAEETEAEASAQDAVATIATDSGLVADPDRTRHMDLDWTESVLRSPNVPGFNDEYAAHLRSAFGQLVLGVDALHQAGMLHRDLKPSNVMIGDDGRVVVLDFGLVKEIDTDETLIEGGLQLVGTPLYMSPEQASNEALGPSSDWYSLGIMLFEALHGRAPVIGGISEVLARKMRGEVPSLAEIRPDLPAEWTGLCDRLLSLDPAARPNRAELFAFFDLVVDEQAQARDIFIGREEELAALHTAYEESRRGQPRAVFVHGRSGMGKSALIRVFLGQVQGQGARVLSGRCYQQESVPYKAWDQIIDALVTALKAIPDAFEMVPNEVGALVRLFPVLEQVQAFADIAVAAPPIADVKEAQRRAFKAIKEVFERLGKRGPLVLFIDDLQWGDADSARLLAELFRKPGAPGLLLVGSYRSDEVEDSPMLRSALELKGLQSIELHGLSTEEVARLTAQFWGEDETPTIAAEELARDSEGSPYFVAELARHAQHLKRREQDRPDTGALGLDGMLRARVQELPELSQAFLDLVVVAGHPIALSCLQGVLDEPIGPSELNALRAGHLLRLRPAPEGPQAEPYHDRIRESLLEALEPERRAELHRVIAQALEDSGHADVELLAVHYRAAGDEARANDYVLRAANRAYEALAFERAARLYRIGVEGLRQGSMHRAAIQVRLAESLSNARRGLEAAREFAAAADFFKPERALELRHKAAHHYFSSGHMDEGMALSRRVLASVGMRLPEYSALDQLRMLGRWAAFRLRSLDPLAPPKAPATDKLLLRIDACFFIASAMNSVDILASSDFCHRMLVLALEAREPGRLARALASEAYMCINLGRIGRRAQITRSRRLLEQSIALAERVADPYPLAYYNFIGGVCCFVEGRFRRGFQMCSEAVRLFNDFCDASSWELDSSHCFRLWSLAGMGEARKVSAAVPDLVEEARERRDNYALLTLGCINLNWYHLYADRPERAVEEVLDNLARCDKAVGRAAGLHIWTRFVVRADQALYQGRGAEAWTVVEEDWGPMKRHDVLEIQFARTQCWDSYGRCALAGAVANKDKGALLRRAADAARRLGKEPVRHAPGLSRMLRAGVAYQKGRLQDAALLLNGAERRFQELDMKLHAAVARWRRGGLIGGEAGARLRAEAERWFAEEEIASPQAMSRMIAPGLEP